LGQQRPRDPQPRPQQQQQSRPQQGQGQGRPLQQQPQPQIQTIFGPQQGGQQQFTLGPFTAFNNFPSLAQQQGQQPAQNFQQAPGRAPGLGFESVRNTVVHDSSSQSSSFFSFQRPEFQRPPQPQQIQVASSSVASPTRFPVAERPSPVQPTFFQSFPQLGSFVDPRSSGGGGQRAQRALPEGATVPLEEEVDRQLPTKYRFPDPEFGGFVPMTKNGRGNGRNQRY